MGAFIIAGIIFVLTVIISGIMFFGASMSDSPSAAADVPFMSTFIIGCVLAAIVAATHWLPHIGW